MENNQEALRYNDGKLRWGLVDFKALEPLVQVLEYGANKYTTEEESGDNNWKRGLNMVGICESLQRHLYAFLEGEDRDRESNLHHVGHILCNAMFLSYMIQNRPDLDDRSKKPEPDYEMHHPVVEVLHKMKDDITNDQRLKNGNEAKDLH